MGGPSDAEHGWELSEAIRIPAPIDAVWACIADPDRVSQWWCPPPTVAIAFDPHEGGRYQERYSDDNYEYELSGTVRRFRPPRRFTVERAVDGPFGSVDVVDVDLMADAKAAVVRVTHSFPELPHDRREEVNEYYRSGWSESLHRLSQLVTDDTAMTGK